jgi:hypothetical protein
MTFIIKKTSSSFKYLSRWKNNYKAFAKDGKFVWYYNDSIDASDWYSRNIARDFCSYYHDVLKLMFFHFCISLLVPSLLILVLMLFGGIYVPPNVTLTSLLYIIASLPATMGVLFCVAFVVVAFIENVWPKIKNWVRKLLPERKPRPDASNNTPKQPSVLAMWYDGFKGNFCSTIEFEVENHDQTIHPE